MDFCVRLLDTAVGQDKTESFFRFACLFCRPALLAFVHRASQASKTPLHKFHKTHERNPSRETRRTIMIMACASYASSDPFATPTSSLVLADLLSSPPSPPKPQRRRIDCLNVEGEAYTFTATTDAGFQLQLSPPSQPPALPQALFLPPLNDHQDQSRDEHVCDLPPGRSFLAFTLKRRRRSLGRAGPTDRSSPSVRPLDDPLDSQKVLEDGDVKMVDVALTGTSTSISANLPFLDPSWSNMVAPTKADPSRDEDNDDEDEEELAIQAAAAAALSFHHRGSSRSSFTSSLSFRPSGSSRRASIENNLFRLRDRS